VEARARRGGEEWKGINKSIYSTFKRIGGMEEREKDREWRKMEIMNKKRPRERKKREKDRERPNTVIQGKGEQEGERPAQFDFAGWVRNNSANYYSALIHIDRYVAPDLYIAWL